MGSMKKALAAPAIRGRFSGVSLALRSSFGKTNIDRHQKETETGHESFCSFAESPLPWYLPVSTSSEFRDGIPTAGSINNSATWAPLALPRVPSTFCLVPWPPPSSSHSKSASGGQLVRSTLFESLTARWSC